MRVFISYCRGNEAETQRLVSDLEDLGHEVWQDQKLSGGQSWWDQVLERIQACDVFAFAISDASLESKACKLECGYAAELRKVILPIHVADDVAPEILPPALATIQLVDHRGSDRDRILQLVQAFKSLPSSGRLPDPLPKPPEIPISYLGSLRTQIDADRDLDFKDQTAILFKLKEGLRKGDDEELIADLLRRLKRRDDLLARVGEQINEVLSSLDKEEGHVDSSRPPGGSARAREVVPAKDESHHARRRETTAPGTVEAQFLFPGTYIYGGLGPDHGIRIMLEQRELGRGTLRNGFDVWAEMTPGEHVLTIHPVDLGSLQKLMDSLGSLWPVAMPFRIPSEGRFRVELIVGKLSGKWKVSRIVRV